MIYICNIVINMQRNKQAKQQPNNKHILHITHGTKIALKSYTNISVFLKKFKYIETKIDDTEAIITC